MTAEPNRVVRANLWSSPATSYYLLVASTSILLLVGMAVVLSSSSISSIRETRDGNPWALFLIQLAALAVGLGALVVGSRLHRRGMEASRPVDALCVDCATRLS